MRYVHVGVLCLSTLALAACEPAVPGDEASSSSMSAMSSVMQEEESSSLPRETANVSYTGVVQPSGISIYMEGTHRLVLSDGRFLLLTADNVELNDYVGAEVEVHGAIRPTVEGNGMIMRVERVTRIASSAASEEMSSVSSVSSETSSDSSVSSVASSTALSSANSSTTSKASSAATSAPLPSSAAVSSAASVAASSAAASVSMGAEYDARVALMAKEDLAADRWTQRYCSTHIGFCVDVHKNWWYKSFGTTTNALWDLEINSEELDTIGDGPIKVLLKSGDLSGAMDGQVKVENGAAIGYRAWTEGRHFEVHAPAALQKAVEMLTTRIQKS